MEEEEQRRLAERPSSEQGAVESKATSQPTSGQPQNSVYTVSDTEERMNERKDATGAPCMNNSAPSSEPVQNGPTMSTANVPQGKSPPVVNPLDHHANERTFNSWQRTSAAYLVIGIALAKFFKGLTAIAGFIFFLIGCVIVVFAALRFESKRKHIDNFEYPAETVGPWIVTLCTVGVGVLSLAALWLGGKPAYIKNGRLFF
ncbi:hypothetical protein GpartN1_g2707.t1 [Galdieria partita]|uniref:DUF202 domain-containing protein n=1 Tax=Galdieria partita TaxID=83374 RepID=A0A9C7UPT4_9RHOD|nr:hypothetical protein GpartN1_g2707.t1 [Galdieria partita]